MRGVKLRALLAEFLETGLDSLDRASGSPAAGEAEARSGVHRGLARPTVREANPAVGYGAESPRAVDHRLAGLDELERWFDERIQLSDETVGAAAVSRESIYEERGP